MGVDLVTESRAKAVDSHRWRRVQWGLLPLVWIILPMAIMVNAQEWWPSLWSTPLGALVFETTSSIGDVPRPVVAGVVPRAALPRDLPSRTVLSKLARDGVDRASKIRPTLGRPSMLADRPPVVAPPLPGEGVTGQSPIPLVPAGQTSERPGPTERRSRKSLNLRKSYHPGPCTDCRH